MAYIQPNSTVQFFGDLGISPNYENTLYFQTEQDKTTYFNGLLQTQTYIGSASSLSYQREHRGFIRVELPISQLYNAGYMRFKNTSFEDKWFYAFVTKVNYINNITTEVEFELDVVMTWMGVFSLKQCFIERQHSETDAIGDNLTVENLDFGDYVNAGTSITGFFDDHDDYVTIIVTTLQHTGEPIDPDTEQYYTYEGVLAGAKPQIFMTNTQAGLDAIADFINKVTTDGSQDAVVGMYMVPSQFVTNVHTPLICPTINKPYSTINGYTPKNNKLFIYPYNVLEVSNMEGGYNDYRYEFFSTPGVVNFEILYNFLPPVQAVLYPKNYKGITANYDESTVMSSFPSASFAVDSYKAYIAQVCSNNLVKTFTGGVSKGITGAALGGATGITLGLAGVATGLMQTAATPFIERVSNKMFGRSATADHPVLEKGNATVNAFYANNVKDFRFNRKQITAEYAKKIDDYFTMFGYAIHEVKTPNMNARPNYTYVKTIGCIVEGNLPTDDAKQIENIFDNGIRFWKNHNNIGNYALPNSPT